MGKEENKIDLSISEEAITYREDGITVTLRRTGFRYDSIKINQMDVIVLERELTTIDEVFEIFDSYDIDPTGDACRLISRYSGLKKRVGSC